MEPRRRRRRWWWRRWPGRRPRAWTSRPLLPSQRVPRRAQERGRNCVVCVLFVTLPPPSPWPNALSPPTGYDVGDDDDGYGGGGGGKEAGRRAAPPPLLSRARALVLFCLPAGWSGGWCCDRPGSRVLRNAASRAVAAEVGRVRVVGSGRRALYSPWPQISFHNRWKQRAK